jgi:N-methylhydantoinase B
MLVSPVHWEDELVGWVANLAHHVDVGGGAPASVGAFREVFQEGIIIPPVKVVEAGALVQDVWKLVLAQIRSKHETGGDLRAQVAANATGIRRVGSVIERHALDTVREAIDELVEYTDRRTRAELERLPHGTYEAEGYVDFDGYSDERVRLHARIELRPDGVRFDVTDSEPQRRAPVNSTYAQTYSACAYAVKCLIDPDLPVNDGFYRLLQVDTRPGTIADCEWPAPVVGGWETQTRLVEVIFRALSDALPGGVPAGTKGMMCHAGFGAVDPELGYWCFLETFGGGYGGRIASDGPDAVQAHGQNTENAPVEETERGYPVRVERLELVEDSEGAGRFRGGLGLRKDYRFPRGPVTFTVLADRDKEGPWGIFGGLAGKPAEYVHVSDGEERAIGSKATVEVKAGDVVSYRTCGGGGYGPPHGREPELVLRDVVEGKVSPERARTVYGVAIDVSARRVDEDETRRLRS